MTTSSRLVFHHDGVAQVEDKVTFVRERLPALWADDVASALGAVDVVVEGATVAVVNAVAAFAEDVVVDDEGRAAIARALVHCAAVAAAEGDVVVARAAAVAADRALAGVDDVGAVNGGVPDVGDVGDGGDAVAVADPALVGVVVEAGSWRLHPARPAPSSLSQHTARVLFAPISVDATLGAAGRALARAVVVGAVDVVDDVVAEHAAEHTGSTRGVSCASVVAVAERRRVLVPSAPWDLPLLATLLPPASPAGDGELVVTGHLASSASGQQLHVRIWRRTAGEASVDDDAVIAVDHGSDDVAAALALALGERVAKRASPRARSRARSAAMSAAASPSSSTPSPSASSSSSSSPPSSAAATGRVRHLAEKASLLPAQLVLAGQLDADAVVVISPALRACLSLLDDATDDDGSVVDDDRAQVAVAAAVGAAVLGRRVSSSRLRQLQNAIEGLVARGRLPTTVAATLLARIRPAATAPGSTLSSASGSTLTTGPTTPTTTAASTTPTTTAAPKKAAPTRAGPPSPSRR